MLRGISTQQLITQLQTAKDRIDHILDLFRLFSVYQSMQEMGDISSMFGSGEGTKSDVSSLFSGISPETIQAIRELISGQ